MKRFLVIIFTVVFVCLAAVVFAPSFIDWSAYKDQAAQQVASQTGLKMDIKGGLGFSILPSPRFFIEDVSVASPEGSKNTTLVSLDRLDVNVSLMPLFQRQVKVTSLTVVKPVIALEMLENGKLNVMTEQLDSLLAGDADASQSTASDAQQISLDQIRIKDASFSYLDHKSGVETKVQNINLDLSAQSLTGPFKAQGSVFYNGHALSFDAQTSAYDAENKMITPKVKLILQPGDVGVQYEGVVSFADAVSLQGQTGIHVDDAVKALSDYNISAQGLSAGALDASGLLTADAKSLSYKNMTLTYNKQALTGDLMVTFAPLSYQFKLSSPSDLNIGAITKSGYGFEKGAINIDIAGNGEKTTFNKSSVQLDGQTFNLSGAYYTDNKSKRPKIDLSVASPKVDYDLLMSKMPKASSGGTMKDSIAALAMPFDMNASVAIDELIWQKKKLSGIALKAKTSDNVVVLDSLSVKDFGGSSVKVSGDIQNVKNVSGITSYVDLNSPDIHKLGKWLAIDTAAWPKQLKNANVKVKSTGSYDAMDVTANIGAMGGEVIAKGGVKTPFATPALSDLVLQLKHKNMAEAVQILSSAVVTDKNLQKPLDFYTKISQSGARYKLEDIKGNLSGISVTGNLDADLGSSVPMIKGALAFGDIKLESVMAPASTSSSTARWSKEPINTSALQSVNADLTLSAQNITYGAWPLDKPKMHLSIKDGVLDITDLTSNVFGGTIALSSSIKTTKEPRSPLYFENSSAFKNVDIGKLSKALLGTQLLKISGDGNLDINLKSSGASPAALIYDLGGTGVVKGSDIILVGIDVTRFVRALSDESKPGDTVMGLWKGSTKGGQTNFERLDGAFVIKNGIVNISSMDLDGTQAKIETTGTVDLPKWYLTTQHTMTIKGTDDVPSDVPPFKMAFKGSLDNPAQTFGQGVLEDYLNRKVQRKINDLISKKLGLPTNDNKPPAGQQPATGQETPPSEQQQQQQAPTLEDAAEGAIKDVLKNLLR
tara:strand:- start:7634 stop:10621 length:2988 start_codon:yes stop_codon:yes gene_type:complete